MNKILLKPLLLMGITLISCKNDLGVSVMIPLEKEIVERYSKNDSLFQSRYDEIRRLADSAFIDSQYKSQYSVLTYSDLMSFLREIKKEKTKLVQSGTFRLEWNEKFGKSLDHFRKDSIRFSRYIDSNAVNKFVEFELLRVYEEKGYFRDRIAADILIKPINGSSIRDVSGYLVITEKNKKKGPYSVLEGDAFFHYRGYTKTKKTTVAYDTEFGTTEIGTDGGLLEFVDLPVEIIKQKYDIKFDVQDLIANDRYIDPQLENVPYAMQSLLIDGRSGWKDYYIRENIDSLYLSIGSYADQQIREKYIDDYKLEYSFYREGYDLLYKNIASDENN